jgi:hypothetical protein
MTSAGCPGPRPRTCAGSCADPPRPDGIDPEKLARIPLAGPGGLQRAGLPGADAAVLDRRVRAGDRLTRRRQ